MRSGRCNGRVTAHAVWGLLLGVFGLCLSLHATEILLVVRSPDQLNRVAWPVTSGIPVPQGRLQPGDSVILQTVEGVAVPLQTEVLGFWPDGSIKWLLLDFQTDLQGGQVRSFLLSKVRG